MQTLLILFAFTFASTCHAQKQELLRRYSFAKSYFGAGVNYFPTLSQGLFLNEQQEIAPFERRAFAAPMINIGATHFWGHADFFVSISTGSIQAGADRVDHSLSLGAVTGARVFPWRLYKTCIRPYVGYKFAPVRLKQANLDGEAFSTTSVRSIWSLGLAYRSPKLYAFAGYDFFPNNAETIFLSRNTRVKSSLPRGGLIAGINFMIETTNGAFSPPIATLDSVLRSRNTMGWFGGLGPSSAFPLLRSTYIRDIYPFLDDLAMPAIFPEFTLGYHFSKQNIIVSANHRPILQVRDAFSFHQSLKRSSFGLEAYKFLFDYHDFAPFFGAGMMREGIRLRERDQEITLTDENYTRISPSIVFGWDIRPGKRADIWLLRTNLRYSPLLSIEKNGKQLSLQQLEFNFIQFVVYPQRIKRYRDLL